MEQEVHMSYEQLPQIDRKDLHIGCATCSTAALVAPLKRMIAVGFGSAYVTRDGEKVYNGEEEYREKGKALMVKDIEKMARYSPACDWRIVFMGPLHGETYQRQGKNHWVCVESNKGFA